MIGSTKIKRRQERPYSAHHLLLAAAVRANKHINKKEPGWIYPVLEANTFSILAIESFANTVGAKVVPQWEDFESASLIAKLRVLCAHLEISFNKDIEPWSSIQSMVSFRNLVVHAKPTILTEEQVITLEEAEKYRWERPDSKLEKLLTVGNANHAVKTCGQIIDIIVAALSPEQQYGVSTDGCFSRSQLYEQS